MLPLSPDVLGSLSVEIEDDPDNERVTSFDCGTSDSAAAINRLIRSAHWLSTKNAIPLRFGLEGSVVAFAVVRVTHEPHPDPGSSASERYLAIYTFGVQVEYQSHRLSDGRKVSDVVMDVCEALAIANGATGLILKVRPGNGPATRLYERHGLVTDPGGPVNHRGVELVTMRKVLV